MPSTPSSQRLVPVNTSQDVFSSIWNQQLLMKSELEPTDNCSIQNNSSPERKMLPTTSPEVITPLVRKSSTCASIESESSLINAQDSKVSSSSTQLVVVPVQVSVPSSSKDSQSITVRNPSSDSPFIHHPKFQPPLLNHTTQSSQLTPSLNTLMLLLCSITKPSTISAEETSILRDPPTPT
jgi:hypothetical protein